MTAPVVGSSRRRVSADWASVALVATACVVALIILFISSGPNGAAGSGWFAVQRLGLLSIGLWIGVGIHSIVRWRLPRGLIIAPLIGALTVALLHTVDLSRIRFNLVDRLAFAAIVAQVPSPAVNLPDRDLTEYESSESFSEFPGPCPPTIGTLDIRECATFAAGYLFYDETGSGLVDDGGIAYLPAGVPRHDVGNGSFESPRFIHFSGPWYAFSSSW